MNAKELAEELEPYPELKARFEELVKIIKNSTEETTLADVAEQRVIDSLRELGHSTLQNWAQKQSEQLSRQVKKKMPTAHKNIKKKYVGTRLTEK